MTFASFQWALCPNCEGQHLVCIVEGQSPMQYGLLSTSTDDDGGKFYTFTYWSNPTEERIDDHIQLELYTDDEEGLKMQALLIAVNGMALAVSLGGLPVTGEEGTKH